LYLFYLDESGCTGTWSGDDSAAQPAIVVMGLLINQKHITAISQSFLRLKRKNFPELLAGLSLRHSMELEIKGSSIRSKIRKKKERAKTELKFLDQVLQLLSEYDVRILGSFWPKTFGKQVFGDALYSSAAQGIHSALQSHLARINQVGLVLADSRNDLLNSVVSGSILSQKLRASGDRFPNIVEAPGFVNSSHHAMIQMADIIASSILWPMCTQSFMQKEPSRLIRGQDMFIWSRYVSRVRKLAGITPGNFDGFHVNGQGRQIETLLWPKPHVPKK
jgi:hypothetical protein